MYIIILSGVGKINWHFQSQSQINNIHIYNKCRKEAHLVLINNIIIIQMLFLFTENAIFTKYLNYLHLIS